MTWILSIGTKLGILLFCILSLTLLSCTTMNPTPTATAVPPDGSTKLQKTITLSGKTWIYQRDFDVFLMKDFDAAERTDRTVKVKVTVPSEWKMNYGVIQDEAEVKVGEFFPGAFVAGPNFYERLPKVGLIIPTPDANLKVLSKEWIAVGSSKVLKLSETGVLYGGLTKPEQIILDYYFLSRKDVSFGFVIYNHLLLRLDEAVIRRMIESLEVSEIG